MSGPRIGSLFSGYGGLEMGVQAVLGGEAVWHSEIDPGACKILAHRYPDVPNLGDITAVDWSAVQPVDVMTGGSPCQDVSSAGKRLGMRPGTRSGLWASMCDAIDITRPSLVVWENVRGVLSAGANSSMEPCSLCVGDERESHLRALGRVVGDLSELGYVGRWVGLRASDVGAPHGRFRVFVAAWNSSSPARRGPQLHDLRPRPVSAAEPREPAGPAAADAHTLGRGAGWTGPRGPSRSHHQSDRRRTAVDADTPRHGWDEGGTEPAGEFRGPDAALPGESTDWGIYEPAIRRWERLTRPAPPIAEPGSRGGHRLSPRFSEWLMGLPAGWVTDVPGLTRNEQLKALGNGVVPQQAAQALRLLLPDVAAVAA